MKRVSKSAPPQTLVNYASAYPGATWDQMRDDNTNDGYTAARDCRIDAVRDQGGLCAYCESRISPDDPLHCGVEHFHSKADKGGNHNWSLDWQNMLAVCDGGSKRTQEDKALYPLPENLSCDAHKDHMVNRGKLATKCEGFLLNPTNAPAFPNVFSFHKGTGCLSPNAECCEGVEIPGNAYESTTELISHTIEFLNLNCDRLVERRRRLVVNIDRNKKELRARNISPADMPGKLIQRYFSVKWPEFFTTLRCCLGATVENYLISIYYQG